MCLFKNKVLFLIKRYIGDISTVDNNQRIKTEGEKRTFLLFGHDGHDVLGLMIPKFWSAPPYFGEAYLYCL